MRDDGSVRWARALGGPYRDGCNEVTVAADGAVVTSLDTEGGWTPPGGSPIPRLVGPDTLLVRLGADGVVRWTRRVGGPGYQRGKSIAVGPDGSIDFGGDTPVDGLGRQAWLSRWTSGGTQRWMKRWGGPGDDLAKGVFDDGRSVWAVGPVGPDLAVKRFSLGGTLLWTATVTGDAAGAEIIGAPGGGILFGGLRVPDTGVPHRVGCGRPARRPRRRHGVAGPLPAGRFGRVRDDDRRSQRTGRRDRPSWPAGPCRHRGSTGLEGCVGLGPRSRRLSCSQSSKLPVRWLNPSACWFRRTWSFCAARRRRASAASSSTRWSPGRRARPKPV